MNRYHSLITILSCLIAATALADRNLLQNASFEDSPSGWGITSMPGWDISGNVDVLDDETGNVIGEGAVERKHGLKCLETCGTPGNARISQTVSTVPGKTYVVAGWISRHPFLSWDGAYGRVDFYLNNGYQRSITHTGHVSTHNMNWQWFEIAFKANSATTRIGFQDSTNLWDWGGAMLDGLSMNRKGMEIVSARYQDVLKANLDIEVYGAPTYCELRFDGKLFRRGEMQVGSQTIAGPNLLPAFKDVQSGKSRTHILEVRQKDRYGNQEIDQYVFDATLTPPQKSTQVSTFTIFDNEVHSIQIDTSFDIYRWQWQLPYSTELPIDRAFAGSSATCITDLPHGVKDGILYANFASLAVVGGSSPIYYDLLQDVRPGMDTFAPKFFLPPSRLVDFCKAGSSLIDLQMRGSTSIDNWKFGGVSKTLNWSYLVR